MKMRRLDLMRSVSGHGSRATARRCRQANPSVEQFERLLLLSADVTGLWHGKLLQPSGGLQTSYDFVMDLTESQGQVQGVSRIELDNTQFFGVMSLTGTVSGLTLTFQETAITFQNLPALAVWYIKTGTLELSADGSTMSGPWSGKASGAPDGSGTIDLDRTSVTTATVAGNWQGTLTEPTGGSSTSFLLAMDLTQSQTAVQGTETIEQQGATQYFADVTLTGIVIGREFIFQETAITDQNPSPGFYWLIKTGNLQLSTTEDSMTGPWGTGSLGGTIDLSKIPPAPITWPAPAGIIYGTPLSPAQLDATASVPGIFAYSPPAGTVLHAGNSQTLSVTFTPYDTADYTVASATVRIDVARATPTIRWPSPSAIFSGTPLGPAQLDATASVPGTFAYNPPAGTILGIGNGQRLSVRFSPTDAADYTVATAAAAIDVLSGPQPPNPHGPTGGHLRTKTSVIVRPRSAHVGASVILTATVKMVGSASVIPTGSVEFLDGPAALGTISLSAGTASLVTSSLHPGRNAIRVHYLGTGDRPASTSRAVVVTVKQRHSKAKHAGAHSRRISTPPRFTSGGAGEVGPAAIAAPLLADSAGIGLVTSDQAKRSQLTRFFPGPYPAGILPRTVHIPGIDSPRRQVARQTTPAASTGPARFIDLE